MTGQPTYFIPTDINPISTAIEKSSGPIRRAGDGIAQTTRLERGFCFLVGLPPAQRPVVIGPSLRSHSLRHTRRPELLATGLLLLLPLTLFPRVLPPSDHPVRPPLPTTSTSTVVIVGEPRFRRGIWMASGLQYLGVPTVTTYSNPPSVPP